VGAPASGGGDGKVSINSADATALEQLPGVGPVIAERIVEWRTKNGPFRSVAELAEISGIGPAMVERIEDQVRM
ncbi:MAG TPA: helix-hairpin-helix domain-containing protein, partial [Candidatus Nanopelagicales bacterium]|nr:helix-hairpin-helix domain-containing protein [Candidatus Nanopelagicales bacterium]